MSDDNEYENETERGANEEPVEDQQNEEYNKNIEEYKKKEFMQSLYSIGLDSMIMSFALVIALLIYSAIKSTINYCFNFDKQKLIVKYLIMFVFVVAFVASSVYLKQKLMVNSRQLYVVR